LYSGPSVANFLNGIRLIRLRDAAAANLVVHLAGLGCALLMRAGTPLVQLGDRMKFLSGAPLAWRAGWGVWMLCALALAGFFVLLAEKLPRPVGRAALLCVGAAIAVDLSCDAAQIVLLPLCARGEPSLFVLVERAVGLGGTLVANGLYTLAAVIAAWSLPARERAVGAALGVAGAAMAAGGLLDVPRLIEISTGPTILLFCLFAILAACVLEPRA
jgi:hypothetical protein